jgi:hypothetical protein
MIADVRRDTLTHIYIYVLYLHTYGNTWFASSVRGILRNGLFAFAPTEYVGLLDGMSTCSYHWTPGSWTDGWGEGRVRVPS